MGELSHLFKVTALNLVGVQHLFIVPNIRSSSYVDMLASFPDLKNSKPGDIQEPAIPTLRNLVVVGDPGRAEIQCAVDWKEVLMWQEGSSEEITRKNLSGNLNNDAVVNLQFTR